MSILQNITGEYQSCIISSYILLSSEFVLKLFRKFAKEVKRKQRHAYAQLYSKHMATSIFDCSWNLNKDCHAKWQNANTFVCRSNTPMRDPTPVKKHENIVLNIISADKIGRAFYVKGRPNVPEWIEKFVHWIKNKEMGMSFSLCITRNRHFTAGYKRFARILHSRISNFPMSNNRCLKPYVYICLPLKRNTFTNTALFSLFAKTLLSNKDGIQYVNVETVLQPMALWDCWWLK